MYMLLLVRPSANAKLLFQLCPLLLAVSMVCDLAFAQVAESNFQQFSSQYKRSAEIELQVNSSSSGPMFTSPSSLSELGIVNRNWQIGSALGSLKYSNQLRGLPDSVWAGVQGALESDGTSFVVGTVRDPTNMPTPPGGTVEPSTAPDPTSVYGGSIKSENFLWQAYPGLNQLDFASGMGRDIVGNKGDGDGDNKDKSGLLLRLTTINPDDGIKRSGAKTIYGKDDRRDYYQIPNQDIKKLANGIASISNWSERSVSARGICNAFLIANDLAVTASHCVGYGGYRNLAIRFNDQVVAAGPRPGELDVYEIDDVLTWDQLHDFAVIRIKSDSNGKYPGEKYPVLTISGKSPRLGGLVFMIGSPGLDYKKLSPNCSVVKDTYTHGTGKVTFGIDCEAFGGNSGSPVFDLIDNRVLGVFWGGQSDEKLILKADDIQHEYVVPFDRILSAKSFDVGVWPPEVSPILGALTGGESLANR